MATSVTPTMPTRPASIVTKNGIELIKQFEGLCLKAYLDPIKIPTIGYGTICYENGAKVKIGDVISQERAEELLFHGVNQKVCSITEMIKGVPLNQNQIDSLSCFAYNVGCGALAGSTLLKKVKANRNDPTIRDEFMKWNKARDPKTKQLVALAGLTRRRKAEADLYFS
ncbi:lysozyme [Segetibacter aerophilus]|uniref:Lysozyme n=1 Tax=Segetibacter aerophilus TaxID=670293 RepID=A0A512BGD0_9BACT|nr:lysozyme [Segetibacter aerophilus]GEO11022.1 lysozyme [Segetibacter aerophilus]